jgi:hypothetical protein
MGQVSGLDGDPVAIPTPERDAEVLPERMARAVVVRVRMGERVCCDWPAHERPQESPLAEACSSVYEDIAQKIDVERVEPTQRDAVSPRRDLLNNL